MSGTYITGQTIEAVTVTATTGNFTVANFDETTTGNIFAGGFISGASGFITPSTGMFGDTLQAPIFTNPYVLTGVATYLIGSGTNGFSAGNIELASGATVNIASGSTWFVFS